MNVTERTGDLEHMVSSFLPTPWIDIKARDGAHYPPHSHYVATIMGLQALKCSGVSGYGKTEQEAVQNLRRKVLQYLELNSSREPGD
ncbi:MAG: hypothetical protein V4671_28800 [Armatimonadota bacterium]